ncbi:FHA domain containing protein [Anabaenopsis circularis NIES-21]|uniref:FHA domain containing protein n=1 Tax=Anabaenopsis circularis NIES-21 TaxID=1085406 RepID=A0A1Z4GP20_9CYAN|nr:FHA domain containing protein [Anabaenopsis circularis NIES-21]
MNLWCVKTLKQILPRSLTIIKWLIILVFVLNLNSCAEKAVSQDVSISPTEKSQPTSQQFTEVAPPEVIQELRSTLEVYRPQVTIVTPQLEEIIPDTKVKVQFQVKDLPVFKDPKLQLGPHLHVILDNQPYIPVYDLSQPLVLSDLSPGTHTVRVFATRPWGESFKNEGAYAQTKFHIFTKTDDNSPDSSLPLLTYSTPQGSYGAEPILLDFYLTNAPLRLGSTDNPNDLFSDWRIRCTINGESFVFDRWQAVYLKGFQPGNNWVKLEFLDNQGNTVKNAFNTTVRLVNYQPKGKDTLSRIIRDELKADEVRSIVDQSYIPQPLVPTPTPEPQTIPQREIPEVVQPQPTELPQPEVTPTPQVTESPAPEVIPTTQATESPAPAPEVIPTPQVTESPSPAPEVIPTPQVTESPLPAPEVIPTPQVTESPSPEPEVIPTPQVTEVPEKPETEPLKSRLGKYFQRRLLPTP